MSSADPFELHDLKSRIGPSSSMSALDREPCSVTPAQRAIGTACALVGIYSCRWLTGSELAPGYDVTGNLQRIEFAWSELFSHGRLDGWFSGAMLGYQLHLFYGPGLAALTGLVSFASGGMLTLAGALKVVLIGSYLLTALATSRLALALDTGRWPAVAAGTLALGAGSPRGGGLSGAFETGLAAQQVAVPLVIFALGFAVLLTRGVDRRGCSVSFAAMVAMVGVTHPLSLVVFAGLLPLVVVTSATRGLIRPGWFVRLGKSLFWAASLAGFWWIPALARSGLRGPVTSWDSPSIVDHLVLISTGHRGTLGLVGPVAALFVTGWTIHSATVRSWSKGSLIVLPIGALLFLHGAHGVIGLGSPLGKQFPNRGLVYAVLLAMPAVASALCSAYKQWGWTLALVATVVSVAGFSPPQDAQHTPTLELLEAANTLRDIVPDGARFAVIPQVVQVGVPAPDRWLAWASGRDGLGPFGPEYAPGAEPAMDAIDSSIVPTLASLVSLQELGVSHLVVLDRPGLAVAGALSSMLPVWSAGQVQIFDLARATHNMDRVLLTPWKLSNEVGWDLLPDFGGGEVVLPLGWSPEWTLSIDGQPTKAESTSDGRVVLIAKGDSQTISARFTTSNWAKLGRAISALALLALVLLPPVRVIWRTTLDII